MDQFHMQYKVQAFGFCAKVLECNGTNNILNQYQETKLKKVK
jgi:hypothetical protein